MTVFSRALLACVFALPMMAACGEKAPATDVAAEVAAEAPAEPVLLSNGLTAQQTIETRQKGLKELGASFKTINDQLKSGSPDMALVGESAAKMKAISVEVGGWFPDGTGPEAGIKTGALPVIWESNTDFMTANANFVTEVGKLADIAAAGGDAAAIQAQIPATGGSCKACHDKFRLKDE